MTTTTAVEVVPQAIERQLASETPSVLDELARLVVVTSRSEYEAAAAGLRDVLRPLKKRIHEAFDPICAATNHSHKVATGKRAEHLKPVTDMEARIEGAMSGFLLREQEAARKLLAANPSPAVEAAIDLATAPPVVAGVSARPKWKLGGVLNRDSLLPVYLTPDLKRLGELVASMGPDAVKVATIPGAPPAIEVVEEVGFTVRASKR